MLRNKILYSKEIYEFLGDHFFIGFIFFVFYWKILLSIKNFGLQENYTRYEKKIWDQVSIVKNVIKNETFYFTLMGDTKKMSEKKIVRLKKIWKLALDYFFIRVISFFY